MVPVVIACLVFLVIGTLLAAFPGRVRDFIIGACVHGRWGFWIGKEMILRRVKKPSYSLELRIIGIVCILGAAVCAWVLFGDKKPMP
jgi:membrane protein required for beta-lactamase induction